MGPAPRRMLKLPGLKVKQALPTKAGQSFSCVIVSLGSHVQLGAVVQRGYNHWAFWCRGFCARGETGSRCAASLLQSRHCPRNGKWVGSAHATATERRGKAQIFQTSGCPRVRRPASKSTESTAWGCGIASNVSPTAFSHDNRTEGAKEA